MEEKEKKIVITDQNTVTITLTEFHELMDKAVRLESIADSIRDNIDAGEASYKIVNEDLVRLLTGTVSYRWHEKKEAEETDE